jgi:molecular chaperone GrpE (heat shock protein)
VLPAKSGFDLLVAAAAIIAWMFGAWIAIKPWLEEFQAQNKHLENETLASALEQIQRVEEVASRIQSATGAWQSAQESATRTAAAAREIEEKIRATTKDFIDFQERVNSDEKRHMTLEIEKLRRVEADWLQAAARMLDHTYMLHQAAQRSGQQNLINQLGSFQTAVRDAARRMGLVAFTPVIGERFDNRGHQTETPDTEPPAESVITEVLATGLTFQGQLLRRALVRVGNAGTDDLRESSPPESSDPALPTEPPTHEEESAARTKQETEESIAADESTTDHALQAASTSENFNAPESQSADPENSRNRRQEIQTSPSPEASNWNDELRESSPPSESLPESPEPPHPTEAPTHQEEPAARTKQETEESIAADESTTEPDRPRRRQRKPDPQTSLPF